MTLKSSRRGSTTLDLHGQAVTCIPYYTSLRALEADLGMDWDDVLNGITVGVPVPGTEQLDENGKPIPGTRRLKPKPQLLVDVIFHTQVGKTPKHSRDEIGEWLLGNVEALQEEENATKLARFLVNIAGGDYDAAIAKAKAQAEATAPDQKKDENPSTS